MFVLSAGGRDGTRENCGRLIYEGPSHNLEDLKDILLMSLCQIPEDTTQF